VDLRNPRRVIRAIEVARAAGSFSRARQIGPPRYRTLQIGLSAPPETLRARIVARLRTRIEAGLVAEVERLLAGGVSPAWFEALGLEYRYVTRYLQGQIPDRAELERQLGAAIWRYARRQMTWFRKDARIVWLEVRADVVARAQELVARFLEPR
jgi:tRNA dimethylallyltransferase